MIAELLHKGKENALTVPRLMELCNLHSKRLVTAQVERERAAGALICSKTTGSGGYYLPKDRAEVIEFISTMESRMRKMNTSITAARAYLKQIEGQQCMEVCQMEE